MTVYIGDLLTASAASVAGKPTPSRTWQWLRNGTAISGATSSTYTVAEADIGANLSVKQIETNIAGSDDATSLTVGPVSAVAPFTPASLFASGEEGAWYEPSPTTAFTDTGGTVAATYGQPVAYLQDLSGNGNHATQTTLDSRPILARVPEGGRRNLLERTEEFDVSPWYYPVNGLGDTPTLTYGSLDPDGASTAWRLQCQANGTASTDFSLLQYNLSGTSGVGSIWVKSNTGVDQTVYYRFDATNATRTVTVTTSWQRLSVTGSDYFTIGARGSANGAGPVDILIWHPQVELGSTATAYQKVVDEYDITEAGVTSLDYLSFDGTDDGMATASIDFTSTDKMSVFAGVERATDVNDGAEFMWELSASYNSNAGTFYASANSTLPHDYGVVSRGTAAVSANQRAETGGAPTLAVISGLHDISGDSVILRVNGSEAAEATGDQGAGNFGNYPLYIGARAGTSLFFEGRIYGLIVRNASSATEEITNTEAYLAARSGVTIV